MCTADKFILQMSKSVRMQSAVLGFGVFRVLERYGITSALSIGENVILQTTSVATATMPLAAGKPIHLHVSALSACCQLELPCLAASNVVHMWACMLPVAELLRPG